MVNAFISLLQNTLEAHRNDSNAVPMKAYMKHKFPFLGIKSELRKALLRKTVNAFKSSLKENPEQAAIALYGLPEREYHYCAIELYNRFKKHNYVPEDIDRIRMLITTNSHWDTVDFIAKHIFGEYLKACPEIYLETVYEFSNSSNMWLNRSAILQQLGYKSRTNAELLFDICKAHSQSQAFFIKKAIGWALREFSKINPESVVTFVGQNSLQPLSEREALRLIK